MRTAVYELDEVQPANGPERWEVVDLRTAMRRFDDAGGRDPVHIA